MMESLRRAQYTLLSNRYGGAIIAELGIIFLCISPITPPISLLVHRFYARLEAHYRRIRPLPYFISYRIRNRFLNLIPHT